MIEKNENDSNIKSKNSIIKFKKISKVNVVTIILPADKIAYLFNVDQLTKNKSNENRIESSPINNRLYSISQIANDGPQIIFNQNK